MVDFSALPSPCFLLDEELFRRNLETIAGVARKAGVEIIVALKANATWRIFPVMREYVRSATASSLAEARLVFEEFGSLAHTYAPAYTAKEIDELLGYSSHITFNSLSQYERFGATAREKKVSCGLRINPGYSPVKTALYNPCCKGSRLGVTPQQLTGLPEGIEGFHFHTLCESFSGDLRRTLKAVERHFGTYLPQLKWINMGGGHLITHREYDCEDLIRILSDFRERYPNLTVILEPGSAFTWQTGWLTATVEDIVRNGDTRTLMLNMSFACHLPDCLEMPYKPAVLGARDPEAGEKGWRLGGNSCLAGDMLGEWVFEQEPAIGDTIVFEDMIHYTMVKTTMFNGVSHPSIAIRECGGKIRVIREFGYKDYKNRMC
ncbi:MAG: carboxynorspermidine decarboxylase [Culturomica sp.]|jgi:carboxynorspermidine decarboxylase|nr:carboxynorspermidine decarboxylase [Culturomica sp.]